MMGTRYNFLSVAAAMAACLILSGTVAVAQNQVDYGIKEGIQGFQPAAEELAARERFSDERFGIFIHWGIYSMLARSEWQMNEDNLSYEDYSMLAGGFYPSKFSAAEWVSAIKAGGAKYITITSRHHDGFSMFATKASGYNIVDATPYGKDILKELADECRKQGITLNFYYSLVDWGRADYPLGDSGKGCGKDTTKADYPAYLDFMCAQITELLTNYGPVGCIWFDGDWDLNIKDKQTNLRHVTFDWKYDRLYKLIHTLQPSCLVANNHHRTNMPGEDIQVFERDVPGENTAGYSAGSVVNTRLPLETCQTMNRSWGFSIRDHEYKSESTLIRTLVRTAGRNANLLLNIGPQPDGRLPERALEKLSAMGKWLSENGETIYGTRASMLKPQPWGVLTHKDNKIYLHVMEQPENGTIVLPFALKTARKGAVKAFADGTSYAYKAGKDCFTVSVPADIDCTTDHIIEITTK